MPDKLPPLPPRSRQWSDLVTTDFATLDLPRAIAVLPLGASYLATLARRWLAR